MNKWISVEDRLPEVETEVLVIAVNQRGYRTVTLGMYEDGTMPEENSLWNWDEISFNWDWDEETDTCFVPKSWWEPSHYNPEGVSGSIYDTVTHWMPLPKVDGVKEEDTDEQS